MRIPKNRGKPLIYQTVDCLLLFPTYFLYYFITWDPPPPQLEWSFIGTLADLDHFTIIYLIRSQLQFSFIYIFLYVFFFFLFLCCLSITPGESN
jgi:hypothetical protein